MDFAKLSKFIHGSVVEYCIEDEGHEIGFIVRNACMHIGLAYELLCVSLHVKASEVHTC